LIQTENKFVLGHDSDNNKQSGDRNDCNLKDRVEQQGHEVFLELEPDDFFSHWHNLVLLSAQAGNITSVFFDSLIIQRERTDKNRQLQHKVSNDAQTSHQTEVLQCWHIGQHANEEG